MDLHEYFTADISVDKEELVKAWKSSASASGSRNFLTDYSTLRNWAFYHSLVHVSGQTDEYFTMDVSLHKEIPLNLGSRLDLKSGSGLRNRSPDPVKTRLGGDMRSVSPLFSATGK